MKAREIERGKRSWLSEDNGQSIYVKDVDYGRKQRLYKTELVAHPIW